MEQHEPYEIRLGHPPDFEVEYEFTLDDAFGYIQMPFQAMRSDFMYEGDDPQKEGISMIWPEFLDDNGDVITDFNIDIQLKGKAYMWIIMDDSRQKTHRKRIKEGVKGFFMAGSKKIARATVIKIHGLHTNHS